MMFLNLDLQTRETGSEKLRQFLADLSSLGDVRGLAGRVLTGEERLAPEDLEGYKALRHLTPTYVAGENLFGKAGFRRWIRSARSGGRLASGYPLAS
jgi:hypothetical protein